MQNTLALSVALGGMMLFSSSTVWAEDPAQQIVTTLTEPLKILENKINNTSRPVFESDRDALTGQKKISPRDPFFEAIRAKNIEFEQLQRRQKLEFMQDVQASGSSSESKQKKIVAFRKRQQDDFREFKTDQQEDINKYLAGDDDSVWDKVRPWLMPWAAERATWENPNLPKDPYRRQVQKQRQEFLEKRNERKAELQKKIREELQDGKSPEEIQRMIQKFQQEQSEDARDFMDEMQENISEEQARLQTQSAPTT